jgi:hypothetical protein
MFTRISKSGTLTACLIASQSTSQGKRNPWIIFPADSPDKELGEIITENMKAPKLLKLGCKSFKANILSAIQNPSPNTVVQIANIF